jgi:hypothetical protein
MPAHGARGWHAALDLLAQAPGLKVEKYGIAMDVGAELWEQAKLLRPDFIMCDSETCRWHIAKATGCPSTTRSRSWNGPMRPDGRSPNLKEDAMSIDDCWDLF